MWTHLHFPKVHAFFPGVELPFHSEKYWSMLQLFFFLLEKKTSDSINSLFLSSQLAFPAKSKLIYITVQNINLTWEGNISITEKHHFVMLTSWWQLVLPTPDCGRGWPSRKCHPRAVWCWCIYSLCLSFHRGGVDTVITWWKTEMCSPPTAECNQIFLWQQQKTTGRGGGLMVSWTCVLWAEKKRKELILVLQLNYNIHRRWWNHHYFFKALNLIRVLWRNYYNIITLNL